MLPGSLVDLRGAKRGLSGLMREMDIVVLTRDLPNYGFLAGDVGTIVLVHRTGPGYEVEFMTAAGRSLAIVALNEGDGRPVDNDEVPHARRVATVTGAAAEREFRGSTEIFPGITLDQGVRFGKPCLKDTRIDVSSVLADLAAGESAETVAQTYALTREQVLNALRYASHIVAHRSPAADGRSHVD